MQGLARLTAGALAALWPVLSLAQAGGKDPVWDRGGYKWVWVVSVLVVLIALYRMFFGEERARRPTPPPGGPPPP